MEMERDERYAKIEACCRTLAQALHAARQLPDDALVRFAERLQALIEEDFYSILDKLD